MQITVEIPDALAAEVQAHGVTVESYVQSLVTEKLSESKTQTAQRSSAVGQMQQFADKHGVRLSGLDWKALIHEGHRH